MFRPPAHEARLALSLAPSTAEAFVEFKTKPTRSHRSHVAAGGKDPAGIGRLQGWFPLKYLGSILSNDGVCSWFPVKGT